MLFEMQSAIWQRTTLLIILFALLASHLVNSFAMILTMAIDLRGDEQVIRLNLEEYTGANRMIP